MPTKPRPFSSERAPYSGPSTRYPFDLLCLYSLCLVFFQLLQACIYTDGGRISWSTQKSFFASSSFAYWRILIGFCFGSLVVFFPFLFPFVISFVVYFSFLLLFIYSFLLDFFSLFGGPRVSVPSYGSQCILMGSFSTFSRLTGLYYSFFFLSFLAMRLLTDMIGFSITEGFRRLHVCSSLYDGFNFLGS
jgi:hypothetical protein